jgi:hypothetical protein
MTDLVFRNTGRAWGKVRAVQMADRYEAAIRLEQARQQVRECSRYGFPTTRTHQDEVHAAELAYDAATAAITD